MSELHSESGLQRKYDGISVILSALCQSRLACPTKCSYCWFEFSTLITMNLKLYNERIIALCAAIPKMINTHLQLLTKSIIEHL